MLNVNLSRIYITTDDVRKGKCKEFTWGIVYFLLLGHLSRFWPAASAVLTVIKIEQFSSSTPSRSQKKMGGKVALTWISFLSPPSTNKMGPEFKTYDEKM